MMYLLVLALVLSLISGGHAVQYGAASSNTWKLSGQYMNVPFQGCTSFPNALVLFPGATATYGFNGTAITVLGVTYSGGTDAVISIDDAYVRSFDADSSVITCKTFATFSGLDGTRPHTLKIVVSQKKSRRGPPQPGDQHGIPGGGGTGNGGGGSNLPAAFPLEAVDITPYIPPSTPTSNSPPNNSQPASTSKPTDPSSENASSGSTSSNPASSTTQPGNDGQSNSNEPNTNGPDSQPTTSFPPLTVKSTDTQLPLPDATSSTQADSNTNSSDIGDGSSALGGDSASSTSSNGLSSGALAAAILVPLLVLLLFGSTTLYVLRQRRRNRIPPSAAFKMENPHGMNEIEQRPAWMQDAVEARGRDRSWSNFGDDVRR